MLLYLIRHGKPDYATDTLLEEGWEQARLAAVRLAKGGIDEIHSSPMGRARQTAQPTAEKLGLPIIVEPWAYELGEDCMTTFPEGKLKTISTLPPEYLHRPGFRRMDSVEGMQLIPGVVETGFSARWVVLTRGLDCMLENLGYRRNGDGLYDVVAPNDRHIALFCHAGMLRAVLAHLLNLPFHLLAATVMCHFTGITILDFPPSRPTISPVMISFADTGHLYQGDAPPQIHYTTKHQF
ncbi:MAG: histidine phosphatase family protein [Lentisphaeria bacterium]|nr:histidine phosphatase family protein [Lentisphaeria bacterium]